MTVVSTRKPAPVHLGGLALALAIGLLYVFPHAWLKAEGYRLYYPSYQIQPDRVRSLDGHLNDHTYYTALSREVIDNGIPIREAYTDEGKSMPVRPHGAPETVLGLLIKLVGSVDKMRMASAFLFPALAAWFFYRWVFILTKNKRTALVAAAVAMAGMYPALRRLWMDPVAAGLPLAGVGPYDRLPHPMLSVIPWLIYLIALFRLTKKREARILPATGVGALLGLQIYIYFFYWVHGVILLGLWTLWRLWKKEKGAFKQGLLIAGTAFIVFLPYILLMLSIPEEIRADFSARHSYTHGRFLWLSALIAPSAEAWGLHLLGFLGTAWLGLGFVWREKSSKENSAETLPPRPAAAWFLGMMMLAALIAANQQLITNIILDPKHYYYRNFKPALAVGVAVTLVYAAHWLEQKMKWKHLWLLPIIVILAAGFIIQTKYVRQYKHLYNLDPGVEKALDWLNSHSAVNSVVLTGQGHSGLVPVYTHNNVLLRHGKDFGTHEDGMRRLGLWAALFGMSDTELEQMLEPNPHRQFHHDCIAWHYYPEQRNEDKIEGWIQEVVKYKREADPRQPRYRIDYLLWSEAEEELFGNNENTDHLRKYPVWSEQGCTLYELRPLFPRTREAPAP